MEQPEHRKNAGEIAASINFVIDALSLFIINYTAFFKEKINAPLFKEFSVFFKV